MSPSATSTSEAPSSKKHLSIPLIDFKPLLSSSTEEKEKASKAILSAFQAAGFLYLKNLPIDSSTLSKVFTHSALFFERPQAHKDSLAWKTPSSNRGYVAHGREKVSSTLDREEVQKEKAKSPDLKESFEIGREGDMNHPNQWPDHLDAEGVEFKETMINFFSQCIELNRLVMSSIAIAMGLEETFFNGSVQHGGLNNLRLLHYPPVQKEVFEQNNGQLRAGAHSDFGSITFLFQDMQGGLQVQSLDGEWLDVTPSEGTVVVNAGDLLARWSNNTIRSTIHRVVEPLLREEGVMKYPSRYSIAYFCNPDSDHSIEALPGTWEKTGKKYDAINAGEYLVQRLSAIF